MFKMAFCSHLVQRVGCFKDTSRRAIPQLDGKSILLRGSYRHRKFARRKCALEAARRGYKFMAIQHGGWCASGPRAHRTFARYGRSNRCRNGKGGPWANDVYRISGEVFQKYLLKKWRMQVSTVEFQQQNFTLKKAN